MPKTIAITPSWYWPESVDRVAGIPPFGIHELCVLRHARDRADQPALVGEVTLSFAELAERITSQAPPGDQVTMSGEISVDAVVAFLSAVSRDHHVSFTENGDGVSVEPTQVPVQSQPSLAAPIVSIRGKGGVAAHSHRSLMANAISLATFLTPEVGKPWLLSRPLDTWEGLTSLLLPLYLGSPVVIQSDADPEQFAEAIPQYQPGYAFTDISLATASTREAKRAVRKGRDVLNAMLLSAPGLFEPGDRQRIGKSFRCPALTVFGLAETGAIFAAHPQWYVDESIGIPITNVHVVPADSRDSSPIQTLWELVESAEVTVKGPSLMTSYEDRNDRDYLVDGRFRTGVIASSDANGMIYVLPD
jgi:hypothetical protein